MDLDIILSNPRKTMPIYFQHMVNIYPLSVGKLPENKNPNEMKVVDTFEFILGSSDPVINVAVFAEEESGLVGEKFEGGIISGIASWKNRNNYPDELEDGHVELLSVENEDVSRTTITVDLEDLPTLIPDDSPNHWITYTLIVKVNGMCWRLDPQMKIKPTNP